MLQLLTDLDYRVFKFLNSLAGVSEIWDFIFIVCAEYILYILIAGLALFVLIRRTVKDSSRERAHVSEKSRERIVIQALASAFVGRAIIVPLIRIFFFRTRPFLIAAVTQLVPHSGLEGSFPSGHVTIMFSLAFAFFIKNRTGKKTENNGAAAITENSRKKIPGQTALGIIYIILASISGIARVIVGVHFPLDIIGGVATAALSALIVSKIINAISERTTLNRNGV